MISVLSGTFTVIWRVPYILGLFLLSGVLWYVLPTIIDSTVRLVLLSIGVVIGYRGFSGEIRTDSSVVRRLFMSVIATFISYLLLIISVFSIIIMDDYNYVAFLVLALLGLYVYARLFLAAPASMINGCGPFEALSESWRLTENAKLSIIGAVVLVFVSVFVVLLSLLLLFRVERIVVNVGGVFVIDTVLAGMQAFLYQKLAKTSEPVSHSDTETDVRNVTG